MSEPDTQTSSKGLFKGLLWDRAVMVFSRMLAIA